MPTRPGARAQLFSCRTETGPQRVTLALAGELDVMGAAEARRALLSLEPPRGGSLVVDLRELLFMDSTGVRLILQALGFAERRGAPLVVTKGPDDVQRVLVIVGLAEQLVIVDQIDQEA